MLLQTISGLVLGLFALIGFTIADVELVDTNPDFLGCYKDDKVEDDNFRTVNGRSLEYSVERFSSVQDCVDQCAVKGFLYAGLQNGDLCFCGNYFDKYGRADDADCNIKCRTPDEAIEGTNNPFESCGGRWRNSVYAVTGVRSAERAAARKWWQGKK